MGSLEQLEALNTVKLRIWVRMVCLYGFSWGFDVIRKAEKWGTTGSSILSEGPSFLCAEKGLGRLFICCGEAALHRVLVDGNDPGNMPLAAEPQAYRDPFLLIKF